MRRSKSGGGNKTLSRPSKFSPSASRSSRTAPGTCPSVYASRSRRSTIRRASTPRCSSNHPGSTTRPGRTGPDFVWSFMGVVNDTSWSRGRRRHVWETTLDYAHHDHSPSRRPTRNLRSARSPPGLNPATGVVSTPDSCSPACLPGSRSSFTPCFRVSSSRSLPNRAHLQWRVICPRSKLRPTRPSRS